MKSIQKKMYLCSLFLLLLILALFLTSIIILIIFSYTNKPNIYFETEQKSIEIRPVQSISLAFLFITLFGFFLFIYYLYPLIFTDDIEEYGNTFDDSSFSSILNSYFSKNGFFAFQDKIIYFIFMIFIIINLGVIGTWGLILATKKQDTKKDCSFKNILFGYSSFFVVLFTFFVLFILFGIVYSKIILKK